MRSPVQEMYEGGSGGGGSAMAAQPPVITIFAVMDGHKLVVGFPTREQAEGYLKADKRTLSIREGTFPGVSNITAADVLGRLRASYAPASGLGGISGPPVTMSPYLKDIFDKLDAGKPGVIIDTEYDMAKQEHVFRNNRGMAVRVPKHTLIKAH